MKRMMCPPNKPIIWSAGSPNWAYAPDDVVVNQTAVVRGIGAIAEDFAVAFSSQICYFPARCDPSPAGKAALFVLLNGTTLAKKDGSSREDASDTTPSCEDFPSSPGSSECGFPGADRGDR